MQAGSRFLKSAEGYGLQRRAQGECGPLKMLAGTVLAGKMDSQLNILALASSPFWLSTNLSSKGRVGNRRPGPPKISAPFTSQGCL